MDSIFGALIWLIIIIIWIFSAWKKAKKTDSGQVEKKPSELEKKILEALGIPTPEIPEPAIQEPIAKKKIEKRPAPVIEPSKSVTPKTTVSKEAEIEFVDLFTEEKLEEGIILSVILGPPKAYQFLNTVIK